MVHGALALRTNEQDHSEAPFLCRIESGVDKVKFHVTIGTHKKAGLAQTICQYKRIIIHNTYVFVV